MHRTADVWEASQKIDVVQDGGAERFGGGWKIIVNQPLGTERFASNGKAFCINVDTDAGLRYTKPLRRA